MRFSRVWVVAMTVLAGAACGGDSGIVGTWELDGPATLEANTDYLVKRGTKQLEQALKKLADLEAEVAKAPEAMREELRKGAREKMLASAGDRREIMEAALRSPEEGAKVAVRKAKEQMAKGFTDSTIGMTLKSDRTYALRNEGKGDISVEAGTWEHDGSTLTMKRTTENEIPSHEKATSYSAKLEGDTLTLTSKEVALLFRRRDRPVDERRDPRWIDPCSLITQEEVSKALGFPVGPPKRASHAPECSFDSTGDAPKPVCSISLTLPGPNVAPAFREKMKDKPAVAGIGDAAFEGWGLEVLKGDVSFTVSAYPPPGSYSINPEAKAAIARIVVSRLK